MNKRIIELAKQSGITFKAMEIDGVEYEYTHVRFNDNIAGDEAGCLNKFAELIIKECANVARNTSLENGADVRDVFVLKEAVKGIEKHFEVK